MDEDDLAFKQKQMEEKKKLAELYVILLAVVLTIDEKYPLNKQASNIIPTGVEYHTNRMCRAGKAAGKGPLSSGGIKVFELLLGSKLIPW